MAECGTQAGYQQHRRLSQTACEPCKAAAREYMRDYNQRNPAKKTQYKTSAAVRDSALERLAREYPERFTELYYEEEQAAVIAVA
jgi:hypothetical protein